MSKIKPNIHTVNIFLFAVTIALCFIYNSNINLLYKTITSAGFVVAATVNLVFSIVCNKKPKAFALLMFAALLISMIGDISINSNFILGALLFACGHILYFSAYCKLEAFSRRDMLPVGIIFAVSAIVINCIPIFNFGTPLMQGVCNCYALIISFMLGKAFMLFYENRCFKNGMILLGSALFFVSDLMLLLLLFANGDPLTNTVCLFTYFPAQTILAFNISLHTVAEK